MSQLGMKQSIAEEKSLSVDEDQSQNDAVTPISSFGLAQCRGDVRRTDCPSCIQDAANQIRQRCPNQANARIWYDFCFLRYNSKSFIGEIDTSYGMLYGNVENVTDPDTFNKELGTLIGQIRAQAVETKNEGLGKASRKRDNISNISQPSGKENHMIEPKTESRVLDCSMPAKI
ncbi:cysteine-rich repeat secretory protein 55 [Quercus suber]|uniref:Cysteine-rich repeat secretory protein 55 n=1 Tax=Quercus suber TaxID=58331 RepID=A0AAW0M5P4_QUESU